MTASDRLLFGFGWLFLSPGRIRKVAIGVRPSTVLAFQQALVRRTYRRLFSSSECPKGTRTEGAERSTHPGHRRASSRVILGSAVRRIARIISRTVGVNIDKNGCVRRVLSKHYRAHPERIIGTARGPPIGHGEEAC